MKPERIQLVADDAKPWIHVAEIRALSRTRRFPSSTIASSYVAFAEAVGAHHGFVVQAVQTDADLLLLVFAGTPRESAGGMLAGEDELRACLALLDRPLGNESADADDPRYAKAG